MAERPPIVPVVIRGAPRAPTAEARRVHATIADVLDADRHEKLACCRVIAHLLAADGALDDDERTFLESTLARHGLPTTAVDEVLATLAGLDLDAELAAIGASARTELLRYLETAAALDGRLAAEEAAILERVRASR